MACDRRSDAHRHGRRGQGRRRACVPRAGVLLAQEAATLDLLSGGRFELGLGAGFHRDEYASAGIPFDRHSARVERLGESIRLLKALFGDGPATDAGPHYGVSGLNG
jgi:alkanesulfonate monooxygenase SsuD/methylene tetrahydromethanopterin reductase-like flavin-dependent oxidoreductase (luciferase family)